MTVPNDVSRSGPYTGNGATTIYAYGFQIQNAGHIQVIQTDLDNVTSTLTYNVDYTVSGVTNSSGGNITLISPLPSGYKLTMVRDVPLTQQIELQNQGAYFAKVVEGGFDLSVQRDQQLNERINRALVVPSDISDAIAYAEELYQKLVDFSGATVGLPADNSVSTIKIQNNAVTTAKILDGAVTTAKLQDGAVTAVKIQDGVITGAKLQDNIISSAKLQDGAVTTAKILSGAITRPLMALGLSEAMAVTPIEAPYAADPTGVAYAGTAWTALDTANIVPYLPQGSIFKLDAYDLTNPVYGPGSIRLTRNSNTETFTGMYIKYDVLRSRMVSNPADAFKSGLAGSFGTVPAGPDGQGRDTIAFSFGFKDGNTNRSVILGTQNLIVAGYVADRTELIGNQSGQFIELSERNTALGSNTLQFLSCSTPLSSGDPMLSYVSGPDTITINDVTWDYEFYETRLPGIRVELAAIVNGSFPTDTDSYSRNVAIGRDALNGILIGKYNTASGYQSSASLKSGDGNTSHGYLSGQSRIIGNYNTDIGAFSGYRCVKGDNNVNLGSYAGYDLANGDNNVMIGRSSGASFGADATFSDILSVSNINKNDLISGDFVAENVGIGGLRGDLTLACLHVVRGGTRATSAPGSYSGNRTAIIESDSANGNALIMQAKGINGVGGVNNGIYFYSTALKGFMQYDHSDDTMAFGVNNSTMFKISTTGLGFNGTAPVAKPSITGSRGGNAALASFLSAVASMGLITDSTTA